MIALVAASLTFAVSLSMADEREPAATSEDEKALLKVLPFPDIKGDFERAVSCAGIVKTNGKMEGGGCYVVQPGDEVYAQAVAQGLKKARWMPASIDGEKVDVYLQYRVLFVQKGEDRRIGLLLNPGYEENVEAYGAQHVGAQRILTREEWQKVCPNYTRFSVLARAHVSFEGVPSSVSVSEGAGLPISENCREAIAETIRTSIYIPALADGEPVPSTYTEPFGN